MLIQRITLSMEAHVVADVKKPQGTKQLRSLMRQVHLIENETLEVERTIGAERYESGMGSLIFHRSIRRRAHNIIFS